MNMFTFTNKKYSIYFFMSILLVLASCAKDDIETVVTATEGGAAATGLSGGNIFVGIVVFIGIML